jgi:hypothetical protein
MAHLLPLAYQATYSESKLRLSSRFFPLYVFVSHHQRQSIFPLTTTSLSLITSPLLRARILTALPLSLAILSSGGSWLLIYNHAHLALEACLAWTFCLPVALLFKSGFDTNVGFFACVPVTNLLPRLPHLHSALGWAPAHCT